MHASHTHTYPYPTYLQPIHTFRLFFTLDMVFDSSSLEVLKEEVREMGENMAIYINVYGVGGEGGVLIGKGVLEVWGMVEHHCNILRQVRVICAVIYHIPYTIYHTPYTIYHIPYTIQALCLIPPSSTLFFSCRRWMSTPST
ncbi:hypothetical protein EON63_18345 [archaeon]|nr:MAG: hypothetical protein EON63_18345 [archaeon]